MTGLALPLTDIDRLKRKVQHFCENRPGTYQWVDERGNVIYVGKGKQLKSRLLSYFRGEYPKSKAARIVFAAREVNWQYCASDFQAQLGELRQIKRFRPRFNVRMNRYRRVVFIKVSAGSAPKLMVGSAPGTSETLHYGPFRKAQRVREAVRVLNDLLGLRDCSLTMPITYSDQADLFGEHRRAACIRYELGTCSGPCGGFVTEEDYRERIQRAVGFLDGYSAQPLEQTVDQMIDASCAQNFERAARWREKFESLEWLFAELNQSRSALNALSFVYLDRGTHGEDRAYVIRRGTVRGSAPVPKTPIEHQAFLSLVKEHVGPEPNGGPVPADSVDEMLLIRSWFRRRPSALRDTVQLEEWLERHGPDGTGRLQALG